MKSKVHIVYCHPSRTSTTHLIKEEYIRGLQENNMDYTITDLYGANFNCDLSEEEYLRENNNIWCKLSDDVIEEQEKINDSNILTFIFPLFWMDAPAKLVGYFSRVFTKGFKYGLDKKDTGTMKILDETNFLIITGSSFDDLRRDGKIDALKTIFINDRMAGKSLRNKMYFFSETTYEKQLVHNNKEKYAKIARSIGRKIN